MTLTRYSRTSRLDSPGQASADAIYRYIVQQAAWGLPYIRKKEKRPDLPLFPIPENIGQIIVDTCYHYARQGYRINHDVVAAQVAHESAGMQSLICRDKNNTSGYGAENRDPYGLAVRFGSFAECIDMVVRHLIGYVYGDTPYQSTRFHLISDAGEIKAFWQLEQHYAWSKPADYNATPLEERYGAKLATHANQILDIQEGLNPINRAPRLAIKAGHHNTSGGSAVEYAITGPLAEEYYLAAKFQGFEVFSCVPDGSDPDDVPGDGQFSGTLSASAASCLPFNPDIYLSCHTQGGPKTPGKFGIYPDWGDDVDVDARDTLIPLMVEYMTQDVPEIATWTDGVMSEKQTQVASEGWRLGEFGATAPIKATCTRLIFEHGAHDTHEVVALQNPDVQRRLARAGIEAMCDFLDIPFKPFEVKEPQQAPVNPNLINGFWVIGDIYDEYMSFGPEKESTIGVPVSGMFEAVIDGTPRLVQIFDRGSLAVYADGTPHGAPKGNQWHVRQLFPTERAEAIRQGKELGLVAASVE